MGKELVVDHHLDLAKAGLCHWEILRNLGAEIYYEDLRETRIVGNNGMEVCGLRLVAQLCWDEVFLAGALFDISVSLCCPGVRRRFTLFPPDQLPNLYPGPVELNPADRTCTRLDSSH